LVFIGTTNNDEFLADETGNRRWLPLRVRDVDLAGIKADLLQLWAEGAARFREGGVQFREAQQLAGAVHAEHTISDPWEEAIRHWLAEDSFGVDGAGIKQGQTLFKITSLMQGALGMNVQQLARKDELRVGRILRGLGYEKTRVRDSGHQIKVWGTAQNCKSGQVAFNNPAEGLA
jgi:predicted P-loop ATPase